MTLVERLRAYGGKWGGPKDPDLALGAADRIEELEEALREIADLTIDGYSDQAHAIAVKALTPTS